MTTIQELPHRIIPSLETSQENWEWILANLNNIIITVAPGGGGSDANYVHTQSVASATWTVNHMLGKFANIQAVDSSNQEIIGEITWSNSNSIVIVFSSSTSGKAFVN